MDAAMAKEEGHLTQEVQTMMRSKKKRQEKGKKEPSKYHCIACKRLRQDMFPFPAVDPLTGEPILGQDGKQVDQIGEMCIDVYANFGVNVRHFPEEHGLAMMILSNALIQVSAFFIRLAQKVKPSPIMLAQPGASADDIEKMRRNN